MIRYLKNLASETISSFAKNQIKNQMFLLLAFLLAIFSVGLHTVPASEAGAAVTLNRSACTLNVGESMLLKASITKKSLKTKKVVWKSNKPAVASVTHEGEVKAKKKGSAEIIASIQGTSFKASCKVAVQNNHAEAVPGKLVTVSFPGDLSERDENNAAIFDIDTFSLSFILPDGWEIDKDHDMLAYAFPGLFSKVGILNEKGVLSGIVGYNIYEAYDGAEDNPKAIYNQIALGNHCQFDVRDSYKVVNTTSAGTTALCTVYRSALITGGTEAVDHGIVSYNKELGVYIAMELFSGGISDEQIADIAASIKINRKK